MHRTIGSDGRGHWDSKKVQRVYSPILMLVFEAGKEAVRRGAGDNRGPTLLVPLLLFTLGHRAVCGVSVHGRYTSSPLEPRIELRDARYGAVAEGEEEEGD